MPNASDVSIPQRVAKPGGGFQITGCVVRGVTHMCTNVDARTIQPGEPVRFWGFSASFGRWDTGTSEQMAENILRIKSAAHSALQTPMLGIAIEAIRPNEIGEVACEGSIVMANHDGGSAAGEGDYVITSLTTDYTVTTTGAIPGAGTVIGTALKANGPNVGAGQTGSNNQVLILVAVQ